MRVTILPLGGMKVLMKDVLSDRNPEENLVIPTWSLLIETEGKKILFDTGRTDPAGLKGQLSLCHTEPEDISAVVLSHLHFDHSGNAGMFPDAEIYLQKKEMDEYRSHGQDPLYRGAYPARLPESLHWHLIEGTFQLCRGITLIPLSGHSEGLQGILIEGLKQNLLAVSDACYTSENFGPPAILPGFLHDPEAYRMSLGKIRKISGEKHAWILYGHDPWQFSELKTAPESYE